ncbi:MAG: hypothetical protein DLM68_17675 [Hyphomicrobiales bacterium]|nr:MAG: hypothetical protein DLM68_17675 [Hyphomicrobiales bacterium]
MQADRRQRRQCGDTTTNTLAGIFKNDITGAWVICKLPLDYDAKASKLKEHVRSMPTMHMDRLGVGSDAKA